MHSNKICSPGASSRLLSHAFLMLVIVFVFGRIPFANAADPDCACTKYQSGAVAGLEKYCTILIGSSQSCFPYSTPCPLFFNQQTTPCTGKTNSPTNRPTEPTASPTQPTSSPTQPSQSPTQPTNNPSQPTQSPITSQPSTCSCALYFNGAAAGDIAYCTQTFGTSQFCYPFQSQCPNQNGVPSVACFLPTNSPTLKPTLPTSAPTQLVTTCSCSYLLEGAVSGQSSYCIQQIGTSNLCYPFNGSCENKNGLPTNRCTNPTQSPTSPPTTSTCGCTTYLNGAAEGQSNYCAQSFGTVQLCFPNQTPCQIQNGVPTATCTAPTKSPTATLAPTKAPTSSAPATCACAALLNGAVDGQSAYCYQLLGTSQFCYPYQAQCQNQNGLPTSTCLTPTKSPTTTLAPTKAPTQVSQPVCACAAYLGGAVAGQSNYCTQILGTSQFCYPGQAQCQNQNGLPTTSCAASTISPTKAPTPVSQPVCACATFLGGAVDSQSGYCYQLLGTSQLCYPYQAQCQNQNGLPTSQCLSATKSPSGTIAPTKAPTPASQPVCACTAYLGGAVTGQSNYCSQVFGTAQFCYPDQTPCANQNGLPTARCSVTVPTSSPNTIRPTVSPTKSGPTTKPTTSKPSTKGPTNKPAAGPTVPTKPTASPTPRPTLQGGLTPIAALAIFVVAAFIVFGFFQYMLEKRKERQYQLQLEKQQLQEVELSPVSVI